MFFVLEDPLALGPTIEPPLPRGATYPRRAAPRRAAPPAPEPAPRFTVSEGAEQHVGSWLVVLGIAGMLALIALIGFGPR